MQRGPRNITGYTEDNSQEHWVKEPWVGKPEACIFSFFTFYCYFPHHTPPPFGVFFFFSSRQKPHISHILEYSSFFILFSIYFLV